MLTFFRRIRKGLLGEGATSKYLIYAIGEILLVMYFGRLVEVGRSQQIFSRPRHPYTVSLMSAVPVPDPESGRERILLAGEPPSPTDPPSGCAPGWWRR